MCVNRDISLNSPANLNKCVAKKDNCILSYFVLLKLRGMYE